MVCLATIFGECGVGAVRRRQLRARLCGHRFHSCCDHDSDRMAMTFAPERNSRTGSTPLFWKHLRRKDVM
jgi:hypothetical protein